MCQLDRDDVDLSKGVLQLGNRAIVLPSATIEKLVAHLQITPDLPGDNPLFLTRYGKRADHNTFRKAFHRHCETCEIPSISRADLSKLSEQQRQRFLETPVMSYVLTENELERDQLIIHLLCWLGLRPSEVAKLEARDVQIADKQLILRDTKSGETQILPIPDELVPRLSSWVERLAPRDIIFQISSSLDAARKRVCEIAKGHGKYCGIEVSDEEGSTPRIIRRSLSRILRDNGASLEQIGLLLRHYEARKSTTEMFYAPTEPQHIEPIFDYHPLRLHNRSAK